MTKVPLTVKLRSWLLFSASTPAVNLLIQTMNSRSALLHSARLKFLTAKVSAAVLLFADWPVFLGAITVFLIVLVGTKYVSLSSIMASLLMPLLLHIFFTVVSGDGSSAGLRLPIAVAMAAVVVFSHRENIKRIREKKEPKITLPWEKKKKEKEKGSSGTENAGDAPSGDKKGRKKR